MKISIYIKFCNKVLFIILYIFYYKIFFLCKYTLSSVIMLKYEFFFVFFLCNISVAINKIQTTPDWKCKGVLMLFIFFYNILLFI